MDKVDTSIKAKIPSMTCLVSLCVLLLLAIGLPLGIAHLRKQSQLEWEHRQAQRRSESLEEVKRGAAHVTIMDSLLLPMLANDPECIANLERLQFSMVTIRPEDAQYVARLTEVKHIGLYDTRGADFVLKHAHELPIESLSFELVPLSHDSLRSLSNFPELTTVRFEQVMNPAEVDILKSLPANIVVEIPYASKE